MSTPVAVVCIVVAFIAGVAVGKFTNIFPNATTIEVAEKPAEQAIPAAIEPIPQNTEWRLNDKGVAWTIEWNLICLSTQRVIASTTKFQYETTWSVWKNGAGYGEYTTEATARQQAEKIAERCQ